MIVFLTVEVVNVGMKIFSSKLQRKRAFVNPANIVFYEKFFMKKYMLPSFSACDIPCPKPLGKRFPRLIFRR